MSDALVYKTELEKNTQSWPHIGMMPSHENKLEQQTISVPQKENKPRLPACGRDSSSSFSVPKRELAPQTAAVSKNQLLRLIRWEDDEEGWTGPALATQ